MSRFALSLSLLMACGGGPDGAEHVVLLDVSPYLQRTAERVVVRVWNGDDELVEHRDISLDDTFEWPRQIPLRPREGDVSRSFLLVVDLVTPEGHGMSRLEVAGGYEAGKSLETSVRMDVGMVDATTCVDRGLCLDVDYGALCFPPRASDRPVDPIAGGARCGVVFVDSNAGEDREPGDSDGDCRSPRTPCSTISQSFAYMRIGGGLDATPGTVINIAGDATYREPQHFEAMLYMIREDVGANTVFRHWPGRGERRPEIDASGHQAAISVCCTGVEGEANAAPRGIVFDSLIVRGGYRAGIKLNGSNADDIVIRNSLIVGTGVLDQQTFLGDCPSFAGVGGIFLNNGPDGLQIVNSIIRDGAAPTIPESLCPGLDDNVRNRTSNGIFIQGSVTSTEDRSSEDGLVKLTTIANNTGWAIETDEQRGVYEQLLVRDNGRGGIQIEEEASNISIERSWLVANGGNALEIDGTEPIQSNVRVAGNLIAENAGSAIAMTDNEGAGHVADENLVACNQDVAFELMMSPEAWTTTSNTLVCNEPGPGITSNSDAVVECDLDPCELDAALTRFPDLGPTRDTVGALPHPDDEG